MAGWSFVSAGRLTYGLARLHSVVRSAPTLEVALESQLDAVALTALGTAAMVRARWNVRAPVPKEVVLLGGGILVHGDDEDRDETRGEAAVLDMAASKLCPSTGAIPSLLPSFSGDMGSKK